MATVAEQLKGARETQGLKIHEVADLTKIRGDHIRALEEGNYDVFSAPVYIRGFVRTYAGLLKLDVQAVMAALNKELAKSGQAEPPLSRPAGGFLDAAMFQLARFSRKMVLPVLILLVLAGASVAGYVEWQRYQKRDPLEGLSAGVYPTAPTSGQTLPLPTPR